MQTIVNLLNPMMQIAGLEAAFLVAFLHAPTRMQCTWRDAALSLLSLLFISLSLSLSLAQIDVGADI